MKFLRRFAFVSLICAVIAPQCSKNSLSPEQAGQSEMRQRVETISQEVEKLRGLDYLRPVRVGVVSREEYAAFTSKRVSEAMSAAEEAALSKQYAQMGLLAESDTPLTTILTGYYASFPAAFYSLGTDSLTIITQTDRPESQVNSIIAHELTHALQDQRLTVRPTIFPEYSGFNSDASLAQRALMEGDAMFTEIAFAYKSYYSATTAQSIAPFDSALAVAADYKKEMLGGTYVAEKPVFLDIQSSAPYYFGAAYVAQAYCDAGGWTSVNNLYSISAGPRSIAEINRTSPMPIVYFDFHAIQNLLVSQTGAIEYADDDNAGFALLLGLFYGNIDTARVGRSFDWRGDRYTYVKRSGRDYGTLVWCMAFADKEAASYMFGKLAAKIGERRLAGKTAAADSTVDTASHETVYNFSSASATTKLIRADEQIWWLENTDTLTPRIMDMLEKQKAAPALAKTGKRESFSTSLSTDAKRLVVEAIIRHAFR